MNNVVDNPSPPEFNPLTTPTQVASPWRATVRTAAQTAIGTVVGLASTVLFLATFLPQLLDAVKDALPAEWVAQLVIVIGWVSVAAGAITRTMLIPGVNDWLTKWGAGAKPKDTK